MMKLYGSHLCKDCPPAIDYLNERQIAFTFYDISNSLDALKDFLHYRESEAAFDAVRADGKIGVPCLVDDDGKCFIGPAIYTVGR